MMLAETPARAPPLNDGTELLKSTICLYLISPALNHTLPLYHISISGGDEVTPHESKRCRKPRILQRVSDSRSQRPKLPGKQAGRRQQASIGCSMCYISQPAVPPTAGLTYRTACAL